MICVQQGNGVGAGGCNADLGFDVVLLGTYRESVTSGCIKGVIAPLLSTTLARIRFSSSTVNTSCSNEVSALAWA